MPQLDLIMIQNQASLFAFFVLGYVFYIKMIYPALIFFLKYDALLSINSRKESDCLEQDRPFLKKMIHITILYMYAVDLIISNGFFIRILKQQETPFLIESFFYNLDLSKVTKSNGKNFVIK